MKLADLYAELKFPEVVRYIHEERSSTVENTCSMCGNFYANKRGMEAFSDYVSKDKQL